MASTTRAWISRRRSLEQPVIGDVVGERVGEGILQVGKELCCVEEFGSLQIVEQRREASSSVSPLIACNRVKETSCPITAASCSRRFSAAGSASMRAASTACTVGGTSILDERPGQPVFAARAFEHTAIDQRSHDLFDEERIAGGALDQEALEGLGRLGSEPNSA